MRKEIQNWLDQANDDFDSAQFNFNGKKFYIAAFLCQQAVEKALKALFLYEKKGEVRSHTHSFILRQIHPSLKVFIRFLKS